MGSVAVHVRPHSYPEHCNSPTEPPHIPVGPSELTAYNHEAEQTEEYKKESPDVFHRPSSVANNQSW